MCNELSFHLLGSWTVMQWLLLLASYLLLTLLERELVDCLTWTALNEIASQCFKNFMRLHPNVCLTVLKDHQEHVLEVMVRNQIGKHPNMSLRHQSQ